MLERLECRLLFSVGTLASASQAVTSSFAVEPGAATRLLFLKQSTRATVGVAIQPPVVVELEDGFKNIVTTDESTMTLSIASGPAGSTLGGTDSEDTSKGVATFSDVELSAAGQYRLRASDNGLSVISKPMKVTAGS